jgi:hypothetical protein
MQDELDNDIEDDEQIEGVVKAAREGYDAGFVRPSDSSIEACLLGSATEVQKDEVRAALIKSAAFRRELVSMASDLDSLTDAKTLEAFRDAEAPEGSFLELLLASTASDAGMKESLWSRIRGLVVPYGMARRLYESLRPLSKRFGKPVVAASLLCAALLVVLITNVDYIGIFTESGLPTMEWVVVSRMDAGRLASKISRTPEIGGRQETGYPTHAAAAQAEFSRLITYEDGEYIFDTAGVRAAPARYLRHLLLRLLSESGDTIIEFKRGISAAPRGKQQVRAWTLAIPSRMLRCFDMVSDTACAMWDGRFDSLGCVTFTYGIDSVYWAAKGAAFEM